MPELNLNTSYLVVSFYKFVEIIDPSNLKKELFVLCEKLELKGTIILSQEGINSTISGAAKNIHSFFNQLLTYSYFSDLQGKFSKSTTLPFKKLKILIKKEIVTLKQTNVSVTKKTGIFVDPKDWNALILDPDVLVIDTRNRYETSIGTFKNAVDPEIDVFTEFPEIMQKKFSANKNKKIAMFCTGGIRCEKASAYLLEQGYDNVYQLQGGILKYIEQLPPNESLWQGECFIFDNRGTLGKDSML